MGKLHGISVQLTVKTQTGTDPLGAPVYAEETVTVENVLAAPANGQEGGQKMVDMLTLSGKKAIYILGIPKGDTHIWEDTRVCFFGKTFRTVGPALEGISDLIPLDWDRKIVVECIET